MTNNKFYLILTEEEVEDRFFTKELAIKDAKQLAIQEKKTIYFMECTKVFAMECNVTETSFEETTDENLEVDTDIDIILDTGWFFNSDVGKMLRKEVSKQLSIPDSINSGYKTTNNPNKVIRCHVWFEIDGITYNYYLNEDSSNNEITVLSYFKKSIYEDLKIEEATTDENSLVEPKFKVGDIVKYNFSRYQEGVVTEASPEKIKVNVYDDTWLIDHNSETFFTLVQRK